MSDDTQPKMLDLSLFGDAHVQKYQETGGDVGYMWNDATILLLTTTGRKSGEERTHALIYQQVGEKYVLIASKGGAPAHPAWYLNLAAEPRVRLQVKDDVFDAAARTAEGDEREALWAEACKQWPAFNDYQARTERTIPVVVIERV